MISHGVEISIAGGIKEMVCVNRLPVLTLVYSNTILLRNCREKS